MKLLDFLFLVYHVQVVGAGADAGYTTLPKSISVGYLYEPNRDGLRESPMAVLSLAAKHLRRDGVIPEHTHLEFHHTKMDCDPYRGPIAFIDLVKKNNISSLMGPPCAEPADVIGRLAVPWNILLLSHGSNSEEFIGKHVYKTFARTTLFSPSQTARATALFILGNGWTRVALIENSSDPGAHFLALAIKGIFLELGVDVALHIIVDVTQKPDYDAHLAQIKKIARIIVPIFSRSTEGSAEFLLKAHRYGMTTNKYAYVFAEQQTQRTYNEYWDEANDTNRFELKMAYAAVAVVKVVALGKGKADTFRGLVADEYRKIYPNRSSYDYQYTIFQPSLYDSVYTYGHALNLSVQNGIRSNDGIGLFNLLRWKKFPGAVAPVMFDERVERAPTFVVESFDFFGTWNRLMDIERVRENTTGRYALVLVPVRPPNWRTKANTPPQSVPTCGFDGKLCTEGTSPWYLIGAICGFIGTMIFVVSVYVIRKNHSEKSNMTTAFLIDLTKLKKAGGDKGDSSMGSQSTFSTFSKFSGGFGLAVYDGTPCHVETFTATRSFQLDMSQLRKLEGFRNIMHENTTSFMGISVDGPESFIIIWQFVSSRSLRDVLHNTDIHLDDDFLSTFVKGVVGGLRYLHRSPVDHHGMLTTQTCLVDSRMVVKLSSYGLTPLLTQLVDQGSINVDPKIYDKYHLAPEALIKLNHNSYFGSKQADMFSLGMVLYQILTRRELYEDYILTPEEILAKVCSPTTALMRPDIPVSVTTSWGEPMKQMLTKSWDHDPLNRPNADEFHNVVSAASKKFTGSIMEKMMDRMERYTANLEQLVIERTQEAKDQQQRAECLLMEMLPKSVAERLQQGIAIEPEQFDKSTILFTDIVEFTNLTAEFTPIQVITFLNEIYGAFDSLIEKRNVYKVETIGDSYMVVSGVPNKTDKHAIEIVALALDMRDFMHDYVLPFAHDRQMLVRFGAHSGPVVSGIVGSKMPRFCLFGDSVNFASRMKSTGVAMKIQVSKEVKKLLKHIPKYSVYKRGEIEVKGKGKMVTYFVERADGEIGSTASLHLPGKEALKGVANMATSPKPSAIVPQKSPIKSTPVPSPVPSRASAGQFPGLTNPKVTSAASPTFVKPKSLPPISTG